MSEVVEPVACHACRRAPEIHHAPQSVARCTNPGCAEQPVVMTHRDVEDVVAAWNETNRRRMR